MSYDVDSFDFEREKSFVINFVNHTKSLHNGYNISVMTFSARHHYVANFNSFSNSSQLIGAIRHAVYETGERHLDIPLSHVPSLFSKQNGGRTFAAKIVFLVTSGPTFSHQTSVNRLALSLPNHHNITVFVIGVTSKADVPEVTNIARNSKHLFKLNNFWEFDTLPDELLNTFCKGKYLAKFPDLMEFKFKNALFPNLSSFYTPV